MRVGDFDSIDRCHAHSVKYTVNILWLTYFDAAIVVVLNFSSEILGWFTKSFHVIFFAQFCKEGCD